MEWHIRHRAGCEGGLTERAAAGTKQKKKRGRARESMVWFFFELDMAHASELIDQRRLHPAGRASDRVSTWRSVCTQWEQSVCEQGSSRGRWSASSLRLGCSAWYNVTHVGQRAPRATSSCSVAMSIVAVRCATRRRLERAGWVGRMRAGRWRAAGCQCVGSSRRRAADSMRVRVSAGGWAA